MDLEGFIGLPSVRIRLGLGTRRNTAASMVLSGGNYAVERARLSRDGLSMGAGYNLGDSASIGNHNVEVYGPLAGTGVNGIDADPALVIQDFLINAQYGVGFNPASIDSGSLFTNPNSSRIIAERWGLPSRQRSLARSRHRAFWPAGCSSSIVLRYGVEVPSSSSPTGTLRLVRAQHRHSRRSYRCQSNSGFVGRDDPSLCRRGESGCLCLRRRC